jgi:hypothetical protein
MLAAEKKHRGLFEGLHSSSGGRVLELRCRTENYVREADCLNTPLGVGAPV